LALVWLEPWDGKQTLSVQDLDPLFIEVCRRVRLAADDSMLARKATSESPRIDAKEFKGNLGDPWTPVDRVKAKAFTASASGFDYRTTQDLLVGKNWVPGVALMPRQGEKQLKLLATVLVRGEGKTHGYHERVLPIPDKVLSRLGTPENRDALGEMARGRVEIVATVRIWVLKPAVLSLLQGAPPALNFKKDDRAQRWFDELDARIDAVFFERLWDDIERAPEEANRDWARHVLEIARSVLRDALEAVPIPSARHYRAIAAADRVFEGAARRRLRIAFDEVEGEHDARS
jgi:CRISPR system Cascade subunit CasA